MLDVARRENSGEVVVAIDVWQVRNRLQSRSIADGTEGRRMAHFLNFAGTSGHRGTCQNLGPEIPKKSGSLKVSRSRRQEITMCQREAE